MRSLDTGESPILAVRVPAELNARIERWAAERGEGVTEALRALLDSVSEGAPSDGLVVKPPFRWMTAALMHDCFRKRRQHPTWPCENQWAHVPDEWAFVRVGTGEDWWALDDLLRATVEGQLICHRNAYRIPSRYLPDLATAFRGREDRLRAHHLDSNDGPRLVFPKGD